MTTTFKYRNNGEELHIYEKENDLRFTVENYETRIGVTLDRVGRDALRNYLEGLEEDEVEEQIERVMWADVEF